MDRTPYSRLAEVYDLGWGDFAESSQMFVLRTLKRQGIECGRIVELACGTGILAIFLARSGHTILGVDRSPEMVVIAKEKAQYVPGIEFILGDMRALNLEPGFDAALCMFDSLNYLTVPEHVQETFASVSSVLRDQGVFIFDFNRPLIYSAHDGETLKRHLEHGILLQGLKYDVAKRMARTTFRFPDGEVEIHDQRAYELDEIEPLLESAELSLKECYSDFNRRTVTSASERLICVCRKE